MDLATRIRLGLAEGKSPDFIVSQLVADGMTETTARRLVDRAAMQPAPSIPAAVSDDEDARDGGRVSLIAGAFFTSLGVAITAFTYIRAQPGQRYVITYGMVFVGLGAFGKGVAAWWNAGARHFPVRAVAVATVAPLALFFGLLQWSTWRDSTREARALAAQLEAEESAAALERDAKERARQKQIVEFQVETGRAAQAFQMLMDGDPAKRCAGARVLGEQRKLESLGELKRVADTDPDDSVRACAAAAITIIRNANPDAFRPIQD